MNDIPMPDVLDPQRPRLEGELDADDRLGQARDLDRALVRAAEYGQQLWHQLTAVRSYLVEVLPDPDSDGEQTDRTLTAPRGPGDDHGWERWRTAYEAVTSVLAGPTGDSGLGRHEAAAEAQRRRGAAHASPRTAELEQITTARHVAAAEQTSGSTVPGTGRAEESALDAP